MSGGAVGMGTLGLVAPKVREARRRIRESATLARVLVLGTVGFLFWTLLFALVFRLLQYFRGAAGLGEVLAAKLLGLILLGFLSILVISNVISALSSFFLARDLELIAAAPLDGVRVYLSRLAESAVHSSWMVALVLVPILAAYGRSYHGGAAYVAVCAAVLAAFFLIPAVLGAAVTLVLVNVFPARRARDLLALLGLFGAAAAVLLVRLVRPEQLARPEGFRNLVDFIAAMQTPRSVWLPSQWAADAILAPLGVGAAAGDLFPLLLLASTAAAVLVLGAWLHQRLYLEGFSRAQEGAVLRQRAGGRGPRLERMLIGLGPSARSLVAKDIRTFFRDTTQWSQLILLAVLVAIYVYNVRVLPLRTGVAVGFLLVNLVSFLNLGLVGFVLAAIAARFLFPAVSLEGRTLWLLRSSPLELRTLLWTKFWVGVTPLLVLALALTAATNAILGVGAFMMILSLATVALMTFAIASLALGFGALFPRLESDNAAEISTGFGGLLFMMVATGYLAMVVVLEAWPVHAVLRARAVGRAPPSHEWAALGTALALALAVSALVVVLPLRAAAAKIEALAG